MYRNISFLSRVVVVMRNPRLSDNEAPQEGPLPVHEAAYFGGIIVIGIVVAKYI